MTTMMSVLALIVPCQVMRLPQVPLASAVRHIHSPEQFLEAHGLAPPGARVTETFKPVGPGRRTRTESDHLIAFDLQTAEGPMRGRMFSQEAWTSHIVLLDRDDRVCLLGRLAVKPDGVCGVAVRVWTDLARGVGGWDPAAAVLGASEAAVRAAILAGEQEEGRPEEDANLRLYRRRVLRPPSPGLGRRRAGTI